MSGHETWVGDDEDPGPPRCASRPADDAHPHPEGADHPVRPAPGQPLPVGPAQEQGERGAQHAGEGERAAGDQQGRCGERVPGRALMGGGPVRRLAGQLPARSPVIFSDAVFASVAGSPPWRTAVMYGLIGLAASTAAHCGEFGVA